MGSNVFHLSEMQIDEKPFIRPFLTSFIISGIFILFSVIYIIVSGRIALSLAGTADTLHQYESFKGTIYVIAAGVIIFFILYYSLKRIETAARIILENKKDLVTREKQIAAGLTASSIAHDINNLNQVIMGNLAIINDRIRENCSEEADEILNACEKMAELTTSLSASAKNRNTAELEKADLSSIVRESINLAEKSSNVKNCKIIYSNPGIITAAVNVQLLSRVLLNLIFNAADACDRNGTIEIKLSVKNDYIILEIHDSGRGIPSSLYEKIFEPFYTTKENGTGLGLVSARVFTQLHNGSITVCNSPLGGACFKLNIPQL
jgi:signal transduction histidine kinase